MRDVFELEPDTEICRSNSYILSYPHILSYFAERRTLNESDLVRGAHMVYGWMPTILDLYLQPPNPDLRRGAEFLNKAKTEGDLSNDDISELVRLVNNSLVGISKLLHFINPNQFAIWDSKIYSFVFEETPYNHRVNNIANYREYIDRLHDIEYKPGFGEFHRSVNGKVGYPVSPLRAIELIMFLNAPQIGG
jgi:hypothetical protein